VGNGRIKLQEQRQRLPDAASATNNAHLEKPELAQDSFLGSVKNIDSKGDDNYWLMIKQTAPYA
jgi:hypothetical protein